MVNTILDPIPQVLETLKDYLVGQNGLSMPGIFRNSGDENELHGIRDLLNRRMFKSCKDIYCVATLIKVRW